MSMAEKCPECGTEMQDEYFKCPRCGYLKRNVAVADSISIENEVEVIKKDIKDIKEAFKWNDVRLGALQIFVGVYLAIYLTYVHDATDKWELSALSLGAAAVLVFVLMGIARKQTMLLMDVLTLAYWKNPQRKT